MTSSQPHTANLPIPKQLSYLRSLAMLTGQSFAYPRTRAQASAEIKRLEAAECIPAADRRRETRGLRCDLAVGCGDASSVRDDELAGYGSRATWS